MIESREISADRIATLAAGGYVFAIVDACVDQKAVLAKTQEIGPDKAICLFHNTNLADYYAVGPYLLGVDAPLLEWLFDTMKESPWGIFVFAKEKREALCAHLQSLFMAVLPDGYKWFFRYYDPNVLKTYLLTLQQSEVQLFFGPIRGFGIPNAEKQAAVVFEVSVQSSGSLSNADQSSLRPILPHQYAALEELAVNDFERRVVSHLKEFFAGRCAKFGPGELHLFIQSGIKKAAGYGISGERCVCKFLGLLLVLGSNFEADPKHPWIANILLDQRSGSGDERVDAIFDALQEMTL